ncbi:MAG: LysR family transcriptional regulator [Burkholderiales bacterium]|nr:LysR family transcriptional regulator [Burkholderiales bacterium]
MINLSTRVLRALIVLDELRHFSLAAARCNVTQSALSQMIARLEADVGVRLVDRDRRRVALTAEGGRFVAAARRMVGELDEIAADLRDRVDMRTGHVSLAATLPFAAHWLPPLIAGFRRSYPGIRVELFDEPPARCMELVRERRVDFAVLSMPGPVVGLQYRVLFQESFVLVCPADHALAKRKRVQLRDLAGAALIRFARSGSIGRHLEQALRGVAVSDTLDVEQLPTVAGMVAAGLGVAVVPIVAVPFFDPERVAVVRIATPGLDRAIHLVWRAAHALGPAPQSFVDAMEASMAAHGRPPLRRGRHQLVL